MDRRSRHPWDISKRILSGMLRPAFTSGRGKQFLHLRLSAKSKLEPRTFPETRLCCCERAHWTTSCGRTILEIDVPSSTSFQSKELTQGRQFTIELVSPDLLKGPLHCRELPYKVHIVFRAEAHERSRHPRKQPRCSIRSGI